MIPSTPRSSSSFISRRVVDRPHVHLLVAGRAHVRRTTASRCAVARRSWAPGRPDPDALPPATASDASAAGGGRRCRCGEYDVATRRPNRARSRLRRHGENDATQTRSQARCSAMTRASGSMAPRPLQSMLTLSSGQEVRISLSSGTASRPPMRAWRTSLVRKLRDRAGQVGDPVEGRVVERHDDPVRRRVDVGLDVPVAEGNGSREGDHGVLDARVAVGQRPPAMCHRERQASVVEERVVVRAAQPAHTQQYGGWVRPRRRREPAALRPGSRCRRRTVSGRAGGRSGGRRGTRSGRRAGPLRLRGG